jgi:hypothetical protein
MPVLVHLQSYYLSPAPLSTLGLEPKGYLGTLLQSYVLALLCSMQVRSAHSVLLKR